MKRSKDGVRRVIRSIRMKKELRDLAKEHDINVSEFLEHSLDQFLKGHSECPICKNKLKGK